MSGLTAWQRMGLRSLKRSARKRPGEPLSPEDWEAYMMFGSQPTNRAIKRVLRSLPAEPRCGMCGAPFSGVGRRLVGPLGYRPSRKNPNICATCVELAPPGGTTTEAGVLFADVRGFTAISEGKSPQELSTLLRRYYVCAESVLFPDAIIDKLIGDEVMALYIPAFIHQCMVPDDETRTSIANGMLAHARALFETVGYGSAEGPFVEIGIGLDFGEVFIGNIGDGAVHDFTAVGDVVNTASRLQGQARGGEVMVSARLARHLDEPLGEPEHVAAKNKAEPVAAHRVSYTNVSST